MESQEFGPWVQNLGFTITTYTKLTGQHSGRTETPVSGSGVIQIKDPVLTLLL
jgi:hypothetical protein